MIGGAALFLGVFFLAKFLTRLSGLVILGWELMMTFAFCLLIALCPPMAKHKALRNVWIVRALPVGLFAVAAFLLSWDKTSYAAVLLGAAVVVQLVIVRLLMRKLRKQIEKEKGQEQPDS